ncbi:hypothetical protein HK102_004947, partial [Quaeritorhiza haematococci]
NCGACYATSGALIAGAASCIAGVAAAIPTGGLSLIAAVTGCAATAGGVAAYAIDDSCRDCDNQALKATACPPLMTIYDMGGDIDRKVVEFCGRSGRKSCRPGDEDQAGLCYERCRDGFYGVGPVCWQSCPGGYTDDGAFCRKPGHIYGKGCCCTIWGCCGCDAGYNDDGCTCRIDPHIFAKESYGRGAGRVPDHFP